MTEKLKMSKSISLTADKIAEIEALAAEQNTSFSGVIENAINAKISKTQERPALGTNLGRQPNYWASESVRILEEILKQLDTLNEKLEKTEE